AGLHLDAGLTFDMSFGVDFQKLIDTIGTKNSFTDAFFLHIGDLRATANIALDPLDNIGIRFGVLGAQVVGGHARLHGEATVKFGQNSDGNITFNDLKNITKTIRSLVHFSLDGTLDVSLPLRASLAGVDLLTPDKVIVTITSPHLFDLKAL